MPAGTVSTSVQAVMTAVMLAAARLAGPSCRSNSLHSPDQTRPPLCRHRNAERDPTLWFLLFSAHSSDKDSIKQPPFIDWCRNYHLSTLSSAMIWSISCLEARGRTSLLIKTNAVTEWSSARGVRPSNVDQSWEEREQWHLDWNTVTDRDWENPQKLDNNKTQNT